MMVFLVVTVHVSVTVCSSWRYVSRDGSSYVIIHVPSFRFDRFCVGVMAHPHQRIDCMCGWKVTRIRIQSRSVLVRRMRLPVLNQASDVTVAGFQDATLQSLAHSCCCCCNLIFDVVIGCQPPL
jgi:hypothetical protein